jgi:hypothetical protein
MLIKGQKIEILIEALNENNNPLAGIRAINSQSIDVVISSHNSVL